MRAPSRPGSWFFASYCPNPSPLYAHLQGRRRRAGGAQAAQPKRHRRHVFLPGRRMGQDPSRHHRQALQYPGKALNLASQPCFVAASTHRRVVAVHCSVLCAAFSPVAACSSSRRPPSLTAATAALDWLHALHSFHMFLFALFMAASAVLSVSVGRRKCSAALLDRICACSPSHLRPPPSSP